MDVIRHQRIQKNMRDMKLLGGVGDSMTGGYSLEK